MKKLLPVVWCILLAACGQQPDNLPVAAPQQSVNAAVFRAPALASIDLKNESPYLPPQCYTKTKDAGGQIHNPCYVCHTDSKRPNFMNDQELQLGYNFQDYLLTNQWKNLFKDRSSAIKKITDSDILDYVRNDNYRDSNGQIPLAQRLHNVPAKWDGNGNGKWDGFIPDLYLNFDNEGFDHQPDGNISGWRAFAYAPMPGAFWPTNGSIDDVMIRLPRLFRQNAQGQDDLAVYRLNLAIVESMIKQQDIAIPATDEKQYGVDLDRNNQLGTAQKIVYRWAPLDNVLMNYVGAANTAFSKGEIKMAAGLFPLGTEFLHSLRYLNLDTNGRITMAPRMKELRYARKSVWFTYGEHENFAAGEAKERHDFPDRKRQLIGDIELGMRNGSGWNYQAFIEDKNGDLRPQSFEELGSCVACHSTIGAITDSTFAFRRKLGTPALQQGWYHWSQQGLEKLQEPLREDGEPEYAYYLRHNGAGDEFRANKEVLQRFFDNSGQPRPAMLEKIRKDVSVLLLPSPERALALNKGYRLIVQEQSFREGKEVILGSADNIHQQVESGQPTEINTVLSAF